MPRPAGWTPTTPVDVTNLNANTKDVIGDLNQLNPLYFPNSNLVSAINAVPGMMSKTFYVDAVSGDDNNDGSQTAPFRTIKKAVSSIPQGGRGIIILLSDYICSKDTGDREIIGPNKHVQITAQLDASQRPQFTLKNDPAVGTYSGLLINSNTCLEITNVILESNDNGNSADHWKMLIKANIGATGIALSIGRWGGNMAPGQRTAKVILNDELVDFENAIGQFNFINVDVDAPGRTSTNPIDIVWNRATKVILFNPSSISDLTGGGVNIPTRGII